MFWLAAASVGIGMFGLTDSIHRYLLMLNSGFVAHQYPILVLFHPAPHDYVLYSWIINASLIVAGVAFWDHPKISYFLWQSVLIFYLSKALSHFPDSVFDEYGLMQPFIPFLIIVPMLFLLRESNVYCLFKRSAPPKWFAYPAMFLWVIFLKGILDILLDSIYW